MREGRHAIECVALLVVSPQHRGGDLFTGRFVSATGGGDLFPGWLAPYDGGGGPFPVRSAPDEVGGSKKKIDKNGSKPLFARVK